MANENVIETLISRFTGDASGYTKAAQDIEKANKEIINTSDKTANSINAMSTSMSEGIGEGISAMKRFGVDKFFKSVEEDAATATTQLAKAGEELRKWGKAETFLAGFGELRNMFSKLYDGVKVMVDTDLSEQFSKLWAAASAAVVSSFAKVKAAALATWAAVAASPLAAVAAIAAVAVAIGVAINSFNNYRNKAEQLRQEFEQNAEDRKRERKDFEKETQAILTGSESAIGPGAGTKMLQKELANAGELWEQASERVEAAKEKVERDSGSFFKSLGRTLFGLGTDFVNINVGLATAQGLDPYREMQEKRQKLGGTLADYEGTTELSKRNKEEAKAAQEELDKVNARMEALRDRLKEVSTQGLANIQGMRKEMESTKETLGMDDTERRLHSLNKQLEQLRTHALALSAVEAETADDLLMQEEAWEKVARAKREVNAATFEALQLEQAQKEQDFKNFLKEQTKELERQVDVIGMSAKQLAIYTAEQKAAAAGTTLSDNDRAKLQELYDAVDAKKKLHDLEEKGKKLNKENADPEKKYRDTVTELNTMLDKGYITQETYNKAVEKAGKEFDKTGQKAKKAHNDIMKYEHALVGSLEASDRLEKQRTLFDEQGRDKRARPKVDSRLALDGALKDVETPKSRMEKEEKLMQQQNDLLMKMYEIMLQDEQDDEANEKFIGITGLEITA